MQFALNIKCDRVRAAEHAPRGPFRLLVGLSDRPTATAAELERLLPSHFLRLSRHHRGRDGPRRRAPAKVDRAREAAFVAANAADAAFYELAREAFMGRRLACHGNSS